MTLVMQVRICSRSTRSDVKRVSVGELGILCWRIFLCFSQLHKSHNNKSRKKGSLMMRRRQSFFFSSDSDGDEQATRDKTFMTLDRSILFYILRLPLRSLSSSMPCPTLSQHTISHCCVAFSEASYCSPSRKKKLVSPLRDDSSSSPVLLSTVFFSLDIREAGLR